MNPQGRALLICSALSLGLSCAASSAPGPESDAAGSDADAALTHLLPGTGCRDGWQCLEFGRCTDLPGGCGATAEEDCRAALVCKVNGWCSPAAGRCVAGSDADCAASKACAQLLGCSKNGDVCADPQNLSFQPHMVKSEPYPLWPGAEVTVTYEAVVQPLYGYYCTPCHEGERSADCLGGSCLASSYDDALLPSYICTDKTMAACGATRLRQTWDPTGQSGGLMQAEQYLLVPSPHIEVLERWISGGFPR